MQAIAAPSIVAALSDGELCRRLSAAVLAECATGADVIAHLAELDRRKLYLDAACSSLYSYCVRRLGYSEDGAHTRVRVARLVQRLPRALDELTSGNIHMTGLFLLSASLTEENADPLLYEARNKSRREIEELIARWFPRPSVPAKITPLPALPEQQTLDGRREPAGAEPPPPPPPARCRIEPLGERRYRVEFTASAALREKLEHAANLLSHAVPNGDLAEIVERAIDRLIVVETKKRSGTGKPRRRRPTAPGSRHVPVEVDRAVRERDGHQCTFVDAEGRRCAEKRFLTLDHVHPFALGGKSTVENLRLLCALHNAHSARQVFGDDHIQQKIAEARCRPDNYDKVLAGLVRLGFTRADSKRALEVIRRNDVEPELEPLLRAAIDLLTGPVKQIA